MPGSPIRGFLWNKTSQKPCLILIFCQDSHRLGSSSHIHYPKQKHSCDLIAFETGSRVIMRWSNRAWVSKCSVMSMASSNVWLYYDEQWNCAIPQPGSENSWHVCLVTYMALFTWISDQQKKFLNQLR